MITKLRKQIQNHFASTSRHALAVSREAGRIAQRIADVQVLEPRLLLSGIGSGLGKKKVTFLDADGDIVNVFLKSGKTAKKASFDIALDGGANDKADITSIKLSGTNDTSVLTILVKSQVVHVKGVNADNDPFRFVIISPGVTEVGLVSSPNSMKGIAALGGSIDNVQVGDATHVASLGSLAEDLGPSKLLALGSNNYGNLNPQYYNAAMSELVKIDFGIINVTGNLGSLVLRGLSTGENDLLAPITVGGALGALDARFSDVMAQVSAGSIGTLQVDEILSNVEAKTGSVGVVQANDLHGSVTAATEFSVLSLAGDLTGAVHAASFGNESGPFSLSVDGIFSGLIEGGSIHGNLLINSSSSDGDIGFTGTIHATTGDIGNILVTQNSTGFGGHVVADAGSIGNLTAGFFYQAAVEAAGSIGVITSNITTAGLGQVSGPADAGIEASVFLAHEGGIAGVKSVADIARSDFHAGGAIGNVDVLEQGIFDTVIRGGSVGNITTTGDVESTGIQSTTGSIGNLTVRAEGLLDSNVQAATSIGDINVGDEIRYSSFLAGADIGNISAYYLLADDSGAVIQTSSFTAGGAIGNLKAIAGAGGGNAISDSFFTAGTRIGSVYALATNADGGAAISDTTFTVTGTGLKGPVIGDVTAKAIATDGIQGSTFHAVSGDIGNITGESNVEDGIYATHIIAETGNVGVVTGRSLNGDGGDPGINGATIQAGAGLEGAGGIAGIHGASLGGDGIYDTIVYAGTGGIGFITGISSGAGSSSDVSGIAGSTFHTTGAIGDITGLSASGDGIGDFEAYTAFFAGNGIGNIVGRATSASGDGGIYNTRFNADADNDGVGAIGTITGSSVGYFSGIQASTFLAGSGIGSVLGEQTAGGAGGSDANGISDSFFSADADHDGSGAITTVTGTTNSFGSGIDGSTFLAGSGIGEVTGLATGPYSSHGISGTYADADNDSDGSGAIGSITGKTSTTRGGVGFGFDGITDSAFYAGSGIGNIYGSSTSDDGIGNQSHFDADYDRNGVGDIGTITGKSLGGAYTYLNSGIDDSSFLAGYKIGSVYGYTKATGSSKGATFYTTSGIRDSEFFANAGPSATEAGKGVITSIKGVSTSTNAAAGHYGIYGSYFGAGNGTDGYGYIGSIVGTATSSTGQTDFVNNAIGISTSKFSAGMGLGGTGRIASVTATATAVAGSGSYAAGIAGGSFSAGYLSGTVGTVTATATAVGNGYAGSGDVGAYGIDDGVFSVGTGYGGHGTVDSISGSATATGGSSGSKVNAYGIRDSAVNAGFNGGINTIGTVSGSGVASGFGDVSAFGISDTSLDAGNGVGGVGTISGITGYAKATGTSSATASGLDQVDARIGYHDGTIGDVSGTAIAAASGAVSSTAGAAGINDSTFLAGFGLSTGKINSVTGTATATASGAVTSAATAIGIGASTVYAGAKLGGDSSGDNGSGYIGQITGTATADASGYDAAAAASGVKGLRALAADGDYSTGTVVGVTGTGTATTTAEDDATSGAVGINDSYIGAGVGFKNTGTVGDITGNATATSTTQGDKSDASTSKAYGISGTPIYAGTGSASTGTVGSVTGNVSATALGGSAYVFSYGFKGPYIKVGYAGATTPYIKQVVTAYAKSLYGNAGAYTGGLTGLKITAGFGPYATGIIGKGPGGNSIYGKATATALALGPYGSATARATGVDEVTAKVGTGYKGDGIIYDITGIASANAHSYGLKGSAKAQAYGIDGSSFVAGSAYVYAFEDPKAFGGTGSIGNITGTATAVATTERDESSADALAVGIQETSASAGDATAYGFSGYPGLAFGRTGTIGNVTGTGDAYALAQGFNSFATATGTGIGLAALSAGNARVDVYYGYGSAYGGTGTIGTIAGTGVAKAVGVDSGDADATGIANLNVRAGNAISYDGYAYGGSGYIAKGSSITGTAVADGSASGKYSSSEVSAYGIQNSTFSAGASVGETVAKGAPAAKSTIGDIKGYAGDATHHAYASAGKYAEADAQGINNVQTYVGNAYTIAGLGEATAYYGKLGNVTGNGIAKATANSDFGSADAYASGIKDFYAYAATAFGATAIGGTGIIGALTGTGTATATADTANAKAFGIDPSGFYAGSSWVGAEGGDHTSIADAGTIGNVLGTATATATGNTASGYAAGIDSLRLSAGDASTDAADDEAIAASGVIGTVTGNATVNVTGDNSSSDVYGMGLGIDDSEFTAGNASSKSGDATGASGIIGAISGSANVAVSGTSSATDGDVGGYAYGLGADIKIRAGNAYGGTGADDVAQAGPGSIGNLNGFAKVTVTGTTTGADADVSGKATGIGSLSIEAGTATGDDATGADSGVGSLTGYAYSNVTGTTSNTNSEVGDDVYGIDNVGIQVANAAGNLSPGGSGAAGDGTVGALTGTAIGKVNGTTSGADSEVYAYDVYGINDPELDVSNAFGYTATGGTAKVGDVTGTGTSHVTGITSEDGSDVVAEDNTSGIDDLDVSAGNATGVVGSAGSVAQAGAATLGNFSGTASATVNGTTTGANAPVETFDVYGIGTLALNLANATGYMATGAAASVGTVSALGTANVSGSTAEDSSDIRAEFTYGLDNVNITAGNATGSLSKAGTGTAGTVNLGNISGTASATVSGTTLGDNAEVYTDNTSGIEFLSTLSLGNATGYTATAGAVTTGSITGSGAADVKGTTSGDGSHVFSDETNGIEGNVAITAGTATGGAAKAGSGTGGEVNIGNISGTATVKVGGITTGGNSDVYGSNEYGVDSLTITAGKAGGYTATGGKVTLGTLTGSATANITGTTSGDGSDVFADVYGINAVTITAANADGSGVAGGVGKAGTFTMGATTGTGSATVVGMTSGDSLTVNADQVSGIDGAFSITAANATGYKAYGGATNIGAISGTGTGSADAITGGGKLVTVTANDVYGINDVNISVSNATGSGAKAGIGTSEVSTIGNITGYAMATAKNTSTYKGGGSVVRAEAYGVDDLTINASYASGYTVTSNNGTIGTTTGKGTATATGAYGKQSVSAAGYGIRDMSANVSGVSGTKVTAGIGTIGAVTGTGVANATGYYASSFSKGIDPTTLTAGFGAYGKGSIGAITGTATANSTGDATANGGFAYSYAYGIAGLTVNSGIAYKGTGTIGTITGNGKATQTAAGGGALYGKAYGIVISSFTSGGAKGSGSIGDIKGTGYSTQGQAYGIGQLFGGVSAESAGTIANIGGYGSNAGGSTYGIKDSSFLSGGNITSLTTKGTFENSDAIAGGTPGDGISLGTVNISVGTLGGSNPGYTNQIAADTLGPVTVGGVLVTDPEDDSIVGTNVRIVQL